MSMSVEQKQAMRIHMTPELQQAITVLQYSTVELADFLKRQIAENPVLNHPDEYPELDFSYRETKTGKPMNNYTEDVDPFQFIPAKDHGLNQHLLHQVAMLDLSKKEEEVIKFLINSLNESGFLGVEVDEIVDLLNVQPEEIDRMIHLLQELDPIGIGSRSLAEYLLIQLSEKESDRCWLAREIIKNDLEDLSLNRFRKLAKKYQVKLKEIQQVSDYIRTLNPRPAEEYAVSVSEYIEPDVSVERVNEQLIILVHDHLLPRISINQTYMQENAPYGSQEAESYVQNKLDMAKQLVRSLEQRKVTLYRVTRAIIQFQAAFFTNGMDSLKPMTLKDIAHMVDLHESTVSRATSNKYIQTPYGLFDFKFFFNQGLGNNHNNKPQSARKVQETIKGIIEQEDQKRPYSDQKIKELLSEKDVQISRRTVAKYREELGIRSSSRRKRYD